VFLALVQVHFVLKAVSSIGNSQSFSSDDVLGEKLGVFVAE
jgi:hypothetical protein